MHIVDVDDPDDAASGTAKEGHGRDRFTFLLGGSDGEFLPGEDPA